MPTRLGRDSKGCFARWGSQTKYYYQCGNAAARERARGKANAQGAAIRASGFVGKQEGVMPNFSKMLKRKSPEPEGLRDGRGSAWTDMAEGHLHEFQVAMDESGNLIEDYDLYPMKGYGQTCYTERHFHIIYEDGVTGPANDEPGGHTHTFTKPEVGGGRM